MDLYNEIIDLSPESLQTFVVSVLRKQAIQQNKKLILDYQFKYWDKNSKPTYSTFDAVMQGTNEYDGETTVFFICSRRKTESKWEELLSRQADVAAQIFKSCKTVLITNQINYRGFGLNKEFYGKYATQPFEIWGPDTLSEWAEKYQIDYAVATHKKNSGASLRTKEIGNDSFSLNSNAYVTEIAQTIRNTGPFAIVLGAGASVDSGACAWNTLLDNIKKDLEEVGRLDNPSLVFEKVGDTSLTTAQMCKELYGSEKNFIWKVHEGLYSKETPTRKGSELWQIARMAIACSDNPHFRILTYNYDDFLERCLDKFGEKYNSIYCIKQEFSNDEQFTSVYRMFGSLNANLSIYHVHGFLPKTRGKTLLDKNHIQSVCLTEADYNMLYNQPYSWPISSQLSFFRENSCLFVGCSLADPNIRRLLEMTKSENHVHYAIMSQSGLSNNDLLQVTAHFSRLGIEIIWVTDYSEIAKLLEKIVHLSGKSVPV